MSDLGREMARVKTRVDAQILDHLLPASASTHEVDLLYKMMRDYPQRQAKGLRPFICIAACRAFGGKEEDAFLTAASLELFQNWILIHDDIEDASEMRRGSPALHKKYDWTLALNAGDALHARMWGALLDNETRLGPTKTLRILAEFYKMINETTEGQHIELGWVVGRRWDLREEDYYLMCTKKTSWYTTIAPLRLGGVIADAHEEDLDRLISIGTKLGVGFQIQDDVLNLSGDEEKYGKEIADDLLEGKRTLILIHLLESCSEAERARFILIMNKRRDEKLEDGDGIHEVLALIHKYGAIDYAREKARGLVNEARTELKKLGWKGEREWVVLLDEVARFAVERQW
jgi:geranylgeranyl diphosphate synthase type II